MYATLNSKTRKARKSHRCDYCGGVIEKGIEYDWSKHIYDGYMYEWRTHKECSRIASAIWDYADPDEGMDEDYFHEACHEVCQRFICPDCSKWNNDYEECDDDNSYCIDKMDAFFQTYELYKAGRKGYYEVWKCREKGRAADEQN